MSRWRHFGGQSSNAVHGSCANFLDSGLRRNDEGPGSTGRSELLAAAPRVVDDELPSAVGLAAHDLDAVTFHLDSVAVLV
jgi:hypothetical protein